MREAALLSYFVDGLAWVTLWLNPAVLETHCASITLNLLGSQSTVFGAILASTGAAHGSLASTGAAHVARKQS